MLLPCAAALLAFTRPPKEHNSTQALVTLPLRHLLYASPLCPPMVLPLPPVLSYLVFFPCTCSFPPLFPPSLDPLLVTGRNITGGSGTDANTPTLRLLPPPPPSSFLSLPPSPSLRFRSSFHLLSLSLRLFLSLMTVSSCLPLIYFLPVALINRPAFSVLLLLASCFCFAFFFL